MKFLFLFLTLAIPAWSQFFSGTANKIVRKPTLPATCTKSQVAYDDSGDVGYICGPDDTWTALASGGGGGGDITGVSVACGVGGGGTTGTVTVRASQVIVARTGTTDTLLDGDCGKLITYSNAGSIAVTLPQANSSTFISGWVVEIQNIGVGTVTITPTTSTIDGAASLTLGTNKGVKIFSNATNYFTLRGRPTLVSGDVPNNGADTTGTAAKADALTNNPTDCSVANTFANVIAASGNLTCDYERLPARAVTGTTDTILSTDLSKFITYTNAGAIAVTLPQATGSFADGFWFIAKNIGAADVTITPTTSTISGTTAIVLSTGEFAIVRSDGTNYEAAGIRLVQGTNVTLTKARTGVTVAAAGGGGSGCTTSGSAGQILVDDGAGGCSSATPTISGSTITGSVTGNAGTVTNGVTAAATFATDNVILRSDGTSRGAQLSAVSIADTTGDISSPGGAAFGVGGSVAGAISLGQGTACSPAANFICEYAPASVTAYGVVKAGTVGVTGIVHNTVSGSVRTEVAPSLIVNADITNATIDLTAKVTGVLPTANIAVALANQTSLRGNGMAAAAGDATIGQVIAHGAKALDFASTATGACATVITDTATGAASTDTVIFNANASIKAVTGYVPASTGGFSISAFPSSNTVSFEGCNWTAGTVDPGSITVNWVVIR